jgi:hypothetical protein
MKDKNLPVPDGPVAPLNWRYFWYVAPPAALTVAYRAIPPRIRRRWSLGGASTSHLAVRSIMAGGGWAAFAAMAVPYVSVYRREPGHWDYVKNTGLGGKQDTWRGPVNFAPSLGAHGPDGAWHHSAKVPWDNPPMPKSGMENKELPDWFPTTGTSATWFEVQPTGVRHIRLLDLLPLLITLRQPPGYPANPPPSLSWNGPKKK